MITFAILVQAFGNSALVAVGLFVLVVPLQVACGLVISALQKRKKVLHNSFSVFVLLKISVVVKQNKAIFPNSAMLRNTYRVADVKTSCFLLITIINL